MYKPLSDYFFKAVAGFKRNPRRRDFTIKILWALAQIFLFLFFVALSQGGCLIFVVCLDRKFFSFQSKTPVENLTIQDIDNASNSLDDAENAAFYDIEYQWCWVTVESLADMLTCRPITDQTSSNLAVTDEPASILDIPNTQLKCLEDATWSEWSELQVAERGSVILM
eukprot:Platyproteum_vivax@DN1404_c0_g1_i1.p1